MRDTRRRQPRRGVGDLIELERRHFLGALLGTATGLLARPLLGLAQQVAGDPGAATPPLPIEALRSSPFVYVSPLKRDGSESRCHAEVWFGWLDGRVVMTVSSDGWKARSIGRGLDRARVWVGDHGSLKGLRAGDQGFRAAPSFVARAEKLQDPALLDRLLAEYARKYPEEIGKWRERMRSGHAEGSRILIRFTPESD